MTSIFARALGPDFGQLHPELQRRFGFDSTDGAACVGTGVMDEVWRGGAFTLPFLYLGTTRHILFPERGRNVPFSIENFAYRDSFGRETVTFVRTFDLAPGMRRRFDATMVYSPPRGRIVDYLGTHQHLAVDLDLRVDSGGGLQIRTGSQRCYAGFLGVRLPSGMTGSARVREWYDEAARRFRIEVAVGNKRFGPLFGYRGSFTVAYVDTRRHVVPASVRPLRENPRV
ncbi:DUF4166 domain-containing protein [Actinopolymorpha alba]|uniref:DUF4166 domain-containing protein n=1 Tax=Actinopolymorpha alba TaxID=533267 RepID=UPI00035DAE0F|nr:DUF4166 domain-containing protein [Actinopolymorpha alba]